MRNVQRQSSLFHRLLHEPNVITFFIPFLIFAPALVRVDAQIGGIVSAPGIVVSEGDDVQGKCNVTYNGTNCLRDCPECMDGRGEWPTDLGLLNFSHTLYGSGYEPEIYDPFADDLINLFMHIFRSDEFKDLEYVGTGQIGNCYYPILFYACASEYHPCVEDENVTFTVQVELLEQSDTDENQLVSMGVGFFTEFKKIPRYPCMNYCNDPQTRQCKDHLLNAMNATIGELPNFHEFAGTLEQWFNCTALEEKSRYSTLNNPDVCLTKPLPPGPPPSPRPPPNPRQPPPPDLARGLKNVNLVPLTLFYAVLATQCALMWYR